MDYYKTFSQRLSEAMTMRNMTAAELSRRTGIGESAISRYKQGVSLPHRVSLSKIAETLCVMPGWLVGDSDVMEGLCESESGFTKAEKNLVVRYRRLTHNEKELVSDYVNFLSSRKNKS